MLWLLVIVGAILMIWLGCSMSPTQGFRSWTHKQDQNGVETAKICKEKVAGRACCPFKAFDAADCSGFNVLGIWPLFLVTALQDFENQKVSCSLAPRIQKN